MRSPLILCLTAAVITLLQLPTTPSRALADQLTFNGRVLTCPYSGEEELIEGIWVFLYQENGTKIGEVQTTAGGYWSLEFFDGPTSQQFFTATIGGPPSLKGACSRGCCRQATIFGSGTFPDLKLVCGGPGHEPPCPSQ